MSAVIQIKRSVYDVKLGRVVETRFEIILDAHKLPQKWFARAYGKGRTTIADGALVVRHDGTETTK